MSNSNISEICNFLEDHCNQSELQRLCLILKRDYGLRRISYENLPNTIYTEKVTALVETCARHPGSLEALVDLLKKEYNFTPDFSKSSVGSPKVPEGGNIDESTHDNFDVFISYNTQDRSFVSQVETDLKNRDIKCWIDYKDTKLGIASRQIEELIKTVKVALIFMGNYGIGPYQEKEIDAFQAESRLRQSLELAPVILPEFNKNKIPPLLSGPIHFDFNNQYDETIEDLARLIKEHIQKYQ